MDGLLFALDGGEPVDVREDEIFDSRETEVLFRYIVF
jgi:hypothetical protein